MLPTRRAGTCGESRIPGEQGRSPAGVFCLDQPTSMPPRDSSSLLPSTESPTPRVLLVDHSPDNREVLRVALERRGAEILEAAEIEAGLDLLRRRRPDVIVLDLEIAEGDEEATLHEFDHAAESHAARLVILGTARRSGDEAEPASFFAKPYHFGPLVHKIEELLATP